MKNNYENRHRTKLIRRVPVIIRLDGKAFHTLTRFCDKPFDAGFIAAMEETALNLCNEIQGAKCAYVQSDEISILLTDFDTLVTEAWFDYNLQKIVSVSAAMASVYFSKSWFFNNCFFDSRAFNIPKEEVANYFVWRQQDWIRNSVQMLARVYYSHKELHKKNTNDIHEMLYQKGVNWAKTDPVLRNGTFILLQEKGGYQTSYGTVFTKNRESVEQYLLKEI